MPHKLIIVESPSKCKKIEGYAGKDYKCLATCGHIYSLNHIKDIDFKNNYKPHYRLIKSKKERLNDIKRFIDEYGKENVYLATDPDREGEAIAWHVCQHFNLDLFSTKRITFNEITKEAVCRSLHNPKTIDLTMVESQQARQTVDIIVGFKTCPVLWKHLGIGDRKSPISAGRCQTPCLNLVYDLHKKEQNKNLKEKYTLKATFILDKELCFNSDLLASLCDEDYKPSIYKPLMLYIGNDCRFSMSRTRCKKSICKAPIPLTTSLLQQKANQYLGMSPTVTMKTAQKLYEKGLITYMRTDSSRYSESFISQAVSFIKQRYGDYLINNPYRLANNNSKHPSAQDGHESIRPTNISENCENIKTINNGEKRLYSFILQHSLQTFMKDSITEHYDLQITVEQPTTSLYKAEIERTLLNENINSFDYSTILFKTQLRKIDYLGWKVINNSGDADNYCDAETYINYKKTLNVGGDKKCLKHSQLKTLQIHPHLIGGATYYSEANLVKQLEEKQIGRPSTYASLVDKIQKRHYVRKMDITPKEVKLLSYCLYNMGSKKAVDVSETLLTTHELKRRLVLQPLGEKVDKFCYSYFETLFNYDFTATLENKLDSIAKGETTYVDVCLLCDTMVEQCIDNIKEIDECRSAANMDSITTEHKSKDNAKELRLGVYDGDILYVKSGIYGYYAQHGINKYSLAKMNMIDINEFTMDKVVEFITKMKTHKEISVLREVDDKISIRKGKRGKNDYIMIIQSPIKTSKYKKVKANKPTFINLKSFDGDYLTCDDEKIREFISEKTLKRQ